MESNKMDQFLREKLDSPTSPVHDDWDKISTRVSFMNFFKFGLYHYNIYYTLAIIASFVGIVSAVFAFDFNHKYYSKNVHIKKQNTSKIMILPRSQMAKRLHENITTNKTYLVKTNRNNSLEPIENIEAHEIVASSLENNKLKHEQETESLLALESIKTNELENSTSASIKENAKPQTFAKRWFVEIYSQPVFSETFTLSAGNSVPDFESTKSKQSYGLMIGMKSYRYWFQTGIEFTFLSKNFSNSFVHNEIIQVKKYETITKVVYGLESGKEIKTIKDSVLVASEKAITTKYNFNHINSYKLLEVPISFGYSFRYSKFNFVPKLGFIFDLYKSAKGSVITNEESLDLNNVSFYKSYFTFSSSFGIYYKLNPFMSFVFEPNFRLHMNGQNPSDNFQIASNKYSSGIKLGLAVDF